MRVLLTGGAGFIGSHLCDSLIATNHEVVILDDFSTGSLRNIQHLENHPNLKVVHGNITDELLVNRVMSEVDGCFHLAAAVGVNLIVEKPMESLTTNIRGSEVVLAAAGHFGVKTLVTSTSEIYGKNQNEFMHEDDDRVLGSPLKSRWTYSEAKAIEEALAYTLHISQGLPTIIARLFNTVGPRQTGHYGMVVPRFVSAALNNRTLQVYGDGTQSRVFCHVSDAIAGLLSLWDAPAAVGDVFNIGGVEEISILQLAELIKEMTNSNSPIELIPYDAAYEPGFEDMQRRRPAISRIEKTTGWKPEIGLKQIITDVVEYQTTSGAD